MSAINKEELDVSKIFLSYIVAGADPVRTSQIANCKVEEVIFLAQTELWDSKLSGRGIVGGRTPEEARAATREVNRASNYVQALRMRALIDKAIQWIYENEENLSKFCSEVNKQGKKVFSMKPLLELTKAAEVCQQLIYRSLGDVVIKEGPVGPGSNLKELHKLMTDMMANLPAGSLPDMKLAEKITGPDDAKSQTGYLDADQAMAP